VLLVNLVAAHATRFKMSWKRTGIIMAHLGVILLLVGEFVTGIAAREGNMAIDEGSSSNFVEDIRTSELAVIDPSDPNDDWWWSCRNVYSTKGRHRFRMNSFLSRSALMSGCPTRVCWVRSRRARR
jgi:hypothetical protein